MENLKRYHHSGVVIFYFPLDYHNAGDNVSGSRHPAHARALIYASDNTYHFITFHSHMLHLILFFLGYEREGFFFERFFSFMFLQTMICLYIWMNR